MSDENVTMSTTTVIPKSLSPTSVSSTTVSPRLTLTIKNGSEEEIIEPNTTPYFDTICSKYHDTIDCSYLTKGGFGNISLCKLKCGPTEILEKQIVLKTYRVEDINNDNELKFMKAYCSDGEYKGYFAQLLFWYIDTSTKTIYICLHKYTDSLERLFRYPKIKPFMFLNIEKIHKKIVTCINLLHRIGYVHLDIKPDNIFVNIKRKMIDKDTIESLDVVMSVLGDFGLIKQITDPTIQNVNEGTTFTWLPAPDKEDSTYVLTDFAKFRDTWAWAVSLDSLLKLKVFPWNYDSGDRFYTINKIIDFVSNTDLHISTIAGLNELKETSPYKTILDYIIHTIDTIHVYYKPKPKPTQHGGERRKISYNNKIYTIYKNKAGEKYIRVNKAKLLLILIRRKYRYI